MDISMWNSIVSKRYCAQEQCLVAWRKLETRVVWGRKRACCCWACGKASKRAQQGMKGPWSSTLICLICPMVISTPNFANAVLGSGRCDVACGSHGKILYWPMQLLQTLGCDNLARKVGRCKSKYEHRLHQQPTPTDRPPRGT